MHFYCKSSDNCLLCNSVCPPLVGSESLDNSVPKVAEKEGESGTISNPNNDCSCYDCPPSFLNASFYAKDGLENFKEFEENLAYAFVLCELLEYPKHKCENYLKIRLNEIKEGGRSDGWFTVCDNCAKMVDEGHSIYHQIEKLQSNFNELKKKLKSLIISSHDVEAITCREELGETVCNEIRNHFIQGKPGGHSLSSIDPPICKSEVSSPDRYEDNDGEGGFSNEDDICDDDAMDVKPDVTKMLTCEKGFKLVSSRNKALGISEDSDDGGTQSTARTETHQSLRSHNSKTALNRQERKESSELGKAEVPGRASKRLKLMKQKKYILSNSESSSSNDSSDSDDQDKSTKEDYFCKMCCAVYQSKYLLLKHETLHEHNDAVKCTKCTYVCSTERALKIHMTKNHASNNVVQQGEFQCSHCPVTYKTLHRLKEHEEVHGNSDAFKCQFCDFVCLLERGMKIHETKYHPDESPSGTVEVDKNESDDDTSKNRKEYSCTECDAVYATKYRLQVHVKRHGWKRVIKCSKCSFVCNSKTQLGIHCAKNHSKSKIKVKNPKRSNEDPPYCCTKCPAKYHKKSRFKEHTDLHNCSSSTECTQCSWVFSDEAKLKHHVYLKHRDRSEKKIRSKDGPFHCDHCTAVYETRHRFREHVYASHANKLVQCDLCEKCFESKYLLDLHLLKKRCEGKVNDPDSGNDGDGSASMKPYRCDSCTASFTSESRLDTHISTKHRKGEFACSFCSSVFPTESKLRFHMSRNHDKIHNVCKVCGYKSHGAFHLMLHMQKHTKRKMYMCEICSKTFVSPTYLTGHKQKEHFEELGVEPIKCNHCDLLLPSKSQLKYHNQKVHEKNFKFFCDACGKGFLFESSLRNHSKIHSTERNEVCQYCGAAYVHNRVLMDHIKNHHPEEYANVTGKTIPELKVTNTDNEGPFVCKFCSEKFTMRYHLHIHLKTHTEIYDKYKCATCGKGYSSQAGVKRHEATVHFSNTFTCNYCSKEFSCKDYLRYHLKNHCRLKKDADAPGNSDEFQVQC